MDWRAFMCAEQSTPLITTHSGPTSNSLIIFIEGGSASVWRVGATKWLPSSNKICTLWLCYASKMLQRLKCFSRLVTWGFKSLVTLVFTQNLVAIVWNQDLQCFSFFSYKTAEICFMHAVTVLNQKYTVILMNKITIPHQHLWISCIINGFSQSDH